MSYCNFPPSVRCIIRLLAVTALTALGMFIIPAQAGAPTLVSDYAAMMRDAAHGSSIGDARNLGRLYALAFIFLLMTVYFLSLMAIHRANGGAHAK